VVSNRENKGGENFPGARRIGRQGNVILGKKTSAEVVHGLWSAKRPPRARREKINKRPGVGGHLHLAKRKPARETSQRPARKTFGQRALMQRGGRQYDPQMKKGGKTKRESTSKNSQKDLGGQPLLGRTRHRRTRNPKIGIHGALDGSGREEKTTRIREKREIRKSSET